MINTKLRKTKKNTNTDSLTFYVQVIELVPESQAYMDLLTFENKLDSTIMRKKLDVQEALKRPIKVRMGSGASTRYIL